MENETNVASSFENPKAAANNTEESVDALLSSYTLPSHVLLSPVRDRILLPGSLLPLHCMDFLHGCTAHSSPSVPSRLH